MFLGQVALLFGAFYGVQGDEFDSEFIEVSQIFALRKTFLERVVYLGFPHCDPLKMDCFFSFEEIFILKIELLVMAFSG